MIKELQKANNAMANVRTKTETYLRKKMTDCNADSYEAPRTAGRSPYEQRRINYALGIPDDLKAYESISDPLNEQANKEKKVVSERNRMAETRKAQNNQKQQGIQH